MTKASEPDLHEIRKWLERPGMHRGTDGNVYTHQLLDAFEAMSKERDEWKRIAQTETEPLFSQRVLVPQLTKECDAAEAERDEFKAARDRAATENYYLREKLEVAEASFIDARKTALEHSRELTFRAEQLTAAREKLALAREALEFYANNSGLYIDHRTNAFMSRDSDGKDFHGAKAREALGELTDKPDAR